VKVKHFTENNKGVDYVVGDIHGCFRKLQVVLDEIGFDYDNDRLFSVGDLVDRGPDSELADEWLAKPWFHAVRGNHELMAIDYLEGVVERYIYSYNGGDWFLELTKDEQLQFVAKFSKLPVAIDIRVGGKLYGIIHAECPVANWSDLEEALNGPNGEGYENAALWNRDRYNYKDTSVVQAVDKIFVGHTPLKQVLELGNTIYIDTGALSKAK